MGAVGRSGRQSRTLRHKDHSTPVPRMGPGWIKQLGSPARAVGGFVEMSLDTFVKIWRRPFQFREFLEQTWMIARVSLIPTLLVAIPFTVLVSFTLNILLRKLGAADLSGAGTAFGTITQLGPVVTVLVVAGAGGKALCGGLGARPTPPARG